MHKSGLLAHKIAKEKHTFLASLMKVSHICEKYRNEKYRDVENPFKFGTWWQECKDGYSTPSTRIVLSFNVLS